MPSVELVVLSLFDYYSLPDTGWRTGLSDYYVSNPDCCRIFGLKLDGKLSAYAVLTPGNRMPNLSFIFTDPAQRRRGLASRLIMMITDKLRSDIGCHLVTSYRFYPVIRGLLLKLGASETLISRVYSVFTDRLFWERMDKRMADIKISELSAFVLRDGMSCAPFTRFGASVEDQLYDSHYSSFHNMLDPLAFRRNPHVDLTLSAALVKNGQLCAYTLLTRTESTVCFEHASESEDRIGRGYILMPFYASISAIRAAEPVISEVKFAVLNDNHRSLSFVTSVLKGQEVKARDNYNYLIMSGQHA